MHRRAPRFVLCFGAAILAVAGCVSSQAAFGQTQAPPNRVPELIALTVLVAHGMTQPGTVDPECRALQSRISPIRFGSLNVVQKRTLRVPFGTWARVGMPGGGAVQMVPISVVDRLLHMQLQVPRGARDGFKT